MKKYIIILILISIFVHAKTFHAIKFKGDVDLVGGEFDRATLLKVCHIEYPPIYKIWKPDPVFDSKQIDDFVENIKNYAHSMGYYHAKVFAKTKDDTIIIRIIKNDPIRVKSIKMDNEFERFSLLKVGKRFRTKDFTQTKKRITRYLEENGYPTYKMNAKALVDLDLYEVNVDINVSKGIKRYFGDTDINNSSKIDNELILEQIKYEENETYDVSKIEESYDNIYRLGVFDIIKIEPQFTPNPKTDINITLQEGKTKELSTRLGYDSYEGFRGGGEYIDHNFFGNLREFRAGGKITQKGYKVYTSFYDPKVVAPILNKFTFRNELSYHNWRYDGYTEGLLTEKVTFGKKLFDLEHFFGFQIENNKIKSDNGALLSGTYLINSLFYKLIIDKRDSPMDARNGYYASIYLEKSMTQLASQLDYLKVLTEYRYIKEYEPMVYAFKTRFGWLSQDTPVFKHFFAGGAMSNRGYEYRDLGPHSDGDPIGGVGLIDSSFETRYHFTHDFSVVGFIDSTTISQEVDKYNSKWYTSYGFGVRYLSVIGPLRFDIGFREDNNFAIHLGIGQVF
jgi:translocation and assembly module TamA